MASRRQGRAVHGEQLCIVDRSVADLDLVVRTRPCETPNHLLILPLHHLRRQGHAIQKRRLQLSHRTMVQSPPRGVVEHPGQEERRVQYLDRRQPRPELGFNLVPRRLGLLLCPIQLRLPNGLSGLQLDGGSRPKISQKTPTRHPLRRM